MATTLDTVTAEAIRKPNAGAQRNILSYTQACIAKNRSFSSIRDKMDAIDIAYARYKSGITTTEDGVDNSRVPCDIFAQDDVTPPIVVSQVDSYVAYLAEVYLSGAPLFPVISSPDKRVYAEQLEALIDQHAGIGGYARQLLMMLRDGAKYNVCAVELDWDSIDQFSVLSTFDSSTKNRKVDKQQKMFTRMTRMNMRNTIWDWSVAPGDVAEFGDYAGYIKKITRTKLQRILLKLQKAGDNLNNDKALQSAGTNSTNYTPNYVENPQISNYIPQGQGANMLGVDWDQWFDGAPKGGAKMPMGRTYELGVFYARIMPSDFGLVAPQPNTPQIWKFMTVNNEVVICAKRIISAYDYLPILFGQPLEDGFDYQTQSIAEGEIPFQDAARTLFNIRFAAARRAIADRGLYLADMISPTDINSPNASAKIPVSISALSQKKLGDAYMQIPFDMRGTETAIGDAQTVVQFSQQLHGVNSPRQGNFQKGNKSVTEWNDTMSGSDGRMRLPALTLEHQLFSPMKSILVLNIFQNGADTTLVSQATGEEMDIKVDELRKATLTMKVADGYTPASKLANTDVLLAGMNMIGTSPILQQAFGDRLPGMFINFMSQAGIKGFDQYDPKRQPAQLPGASGLGANALTAEQQAAQPPTQTPAVTTPTTGAPV